MEIDKYLCKTKIFFYIRTSSNLLSNMKIKKILFFLVVSLFSVGSIIAQPGGGPGGCGTPKCGDFEDIEASIDGQIWLGLIGGLAIGGYFLIKKRGI